MEGEKIGLIATAQFGRYPLFHPIIINSQISLLL
jgi:hypothetical protein